MTDKGSVLWSAAMSRSHQALGELVEELERSGQDRERLHVVRCALSFKRAWVDLAEALAALRQSGSYSRWGYSDLHSYCAEELHLKSATVDKLLLSLSAMRTYAPEVLANRMAGATPPSLDAIDYFSRAVDLTERAQKDESRHLDAPDEVMDQLRAAVFEEGRSLAELRKQFNPVLRPKSPEDEAVDSVRKTRAAVQKVIELVRNVDGLTEKRVARVEAALDALLRDLDALAPPKRPASVQAEQAN